MNKILNLIRSKIFIYILLGLVLVGVGSFFFRGDTKKQTAVVTRMDLTQEVVLTGKVKPDQEVNLGFDRSGRVANVYVSVGDFVQKGQVLATIDAGDISADLAKARASLEEEQIKLRELKSTTQTSFADATKNLEAAIRSGFALADNAVRNKAGQFFKDVGNGYQFEVSITSGNFKHYFNIPVDLALEINNGRRQAETMLNIWQNNIQKMDSSSLTPVANQSIDNLRVISVFMDEMASAVNSFTSADYDYDTTVAGYKTAVSGARDDVVGAISAIVSAKDKLNAAATLNTTGQFEGVLAQEAKVAQAKAVVASLEANLGKTTIVAPFEGIVSVQDAKVGSAVTAGNSLVSMISQNKMYIEANVSEIHISKIAVGNPVSLTFDALPGETFSGEVSYIEPGDVLIDGVVNYKIRITIKNPDLRIKTGLTTNLKIKTAERISVLAVPLYAVEKGVSGNFTRKQTISGPVKTQVQLGLAGNTGWVEVLNGLNEGDIVEF